MLDAPRTDTIRDLRNTLNADLLVMWRPVGEDSAVVVLSEPSEVANLDWPTGEPGSVGEVRWQFGPHQTLGCLPTSLLLTHSGSVHAIATLQLPGGGLTAVWWSDAIAPHADERLRASAMSVADEFLEAAIQHERSAVQSQFDIVLNGLEQGVVIINSTEGTTRLNAEAQHILALAPEEESVRAVADALSALQHRALNAAEINERAAEFLVHRDAIEEQWLWQFATPPKYLSVATYPLDGRAEGRVWVFQDVSSEQEQLALERASFEYRERFETAMSSSSIGVAILDTDGKYVNVNQALCTFLGRTRRDLLTKSWREVAHQGDVTPSLLQLRREVETGTRETVRTELRYVRPDGRIVYGDLTYIPLRDATGAIRFTMAQIIDITAQVNAQRQLSSSERHYRLLAEHASDVIWQLEEDRRLRWASPSLADVLGYTTTELEGTDPFEHVHPADHEECERLWASVPEGAARTSTFRLGAKSGAWIWMSVRLEHLRNDDRVEYVASLRNVDQLVQAREIAIEREKLLAATLDSMLDPHIVLQPLRDGDGAIFDYVFRSANAAACAYNNMRRDELLGSRFLQLFPTLADSQLFEMYGDVVNNGEPLVLDAYPLFNDLFRQDRYYDLRLVPVGDAISFTWRDVTERVQESEARERRAQERERLIRQLPVGVFRAHATPDGLASLDYLSEKAAELLGVPLEIAMSEFSALGTGFHSDDLPGLSSAFAHSIRTLEDLVWEGRGSQTSPAQWLRMQGVFEKEADGRVLLEGIIQDISLSKAYEAELLEARASAEVAAEIKSTFLANMSHEIRTPLTAVLGLLRLLEESELEWNQRDYAVRAEQAAQDLLAILNDILDFSKIEAGSLLIDPQPANINSVLSDIGVVMASNVGQKPIELLFDVDPRLPSTVMVDELRLRQVLMNLAGNAIKFTEHGEVQITLRQLLRSDSAVRIKFEIADTGIGMSDDAIAHAFEGFTQADASIARRYGGSGLGLAISQRLVAQMGGELRIASTLGQGTTVSFSLWLPVVLDTAREIDRLRGLRVLLATARPSAEAVLRHMCEGLNWPATTTTLRDVVNVVERHGEDGPPPDVIVLDIPAGMELHDAPLAALHETVARKNRTSIIVLLTQQTRHLLTVAEERLADAFIVKPFTVSTLFDSIANVRLGYVRITNHDADANRPRSRSRLSGVRVLVAEDNDINRDVVTEMLEREGAVVTGVSNGAMAVTAVEQAPLPFDVVLMDMQMPQLDGLSATREIRGRLGLTELPILAMTANAMKSEREACIRAGMNDHISKPFDFDELVQRLRRWAGLDEQQPSASISVGRAVAVEVLDVNAAVSRLDGDVPFLNQMLQRFSTRLPELVGDLCETLDDGKFKDAITIAHSIKGSAATVGADDCAAAASTLEHTLKAGIQPSSKDQPVIEVKHAAERALEAIAHHLQATEQHLVPNAPT